MLFCYTGCSLPQGPQRPQRGAADFSEQPCSRCWPSTTGLATEKPSCSPQCRNTELQPGPLDQPASPSTSSPSYAQQTKTRVFTNKRTCLKCHKTPSDVILFEKSFPANPEGYSLQNFVQKHWFQGSRANKKKSGMNKIVSCSEVFKH